MIYSHIPTEVIVLFLSLLSLICYKYKGSKTGLETWSGHRHTHCVNNRQVWCCLMVTILNATLTNVRHHDTQLALTLVVYLWNVNINDQSIG